jgi:hypothetical protein
LTVDGREGSRLLHGALAFDTDASGYGNHEAVQISTSVSNRWIVQVNLPPGGAWQAGTTYKVASGNLGPDYGYIYVNSGTSPGCSAQTGTLTVLEVVRTGEHISSFAANFTIDCDALPKVITGEMRWNSSIGYTAAVTDPGSVSFGGQPIYHTGTPKTVTMTGKGSEPVSFGAATIGGASPGSFSITADTCSGRALAYNETCAVTITPHPTEGTDQQAALIIPDNTTAGRKYVSLLVTPIFSYTRNDGTYYPLQPARILDTREGRGAPKAPVGPDQKITLDVTGRGGVPTQGVAAVVLNVTATGSPTGSYLTVYPSGANRPTTSSLNFGPGWTGANSVTVALDAAGRVDIYNSIGTTEVIADVLGYYAADSSMVPTSGAGGQYHPVVPARLLDTRVDPDEKLPAQWWVQIPVNYGAELNSHIRALVVNVTVVDPSQAGFLTTWNGVSVRPWASTLNFNRADVIPNMAVVPVANCQECGGYPAIGVYTTADTHIIVDLLGIFDDGTINDGLRFTPLTPERIADTRKGLGAPAAIGPGGTATITAPASVAGPDTWALAMNVTAVTPTSRTFLTVWPSANGVQRPTSSNLNPDARSIVPNAVYTSVGPTNAFNVYNSIGFTDVLCDVVGSFYLNPDTASSLTTDRSATVVTPQQKRLTLTNNQPGVLLHKPRQTGVISKKSS